MVDIMEACRRCVAYEFSGQAFTGLRVGQLKTNMLEGSVYTSADAATAIAADAAADVADRVKCNGNHHCVLGLPKVGYMQQRVWGWRALTKSLVA